MSVIFESTFYWDGITQSIKFYARFESRRIHCAVSRPALEQFILRRFVMPDGLNTLNYERAFHEHRQEIERQAVRRIRTGRFESEGSIFVKAADFR